VNIQKLGFGTNQLLVSGVSCCFAHKHKVG